MTLLVFLRLLSVVAAFSFVGLAIYCAVHGDLFTGTVWLLCAKLAIITEKV